MRLTRKTARASLAAVMVVQANIVLAMLYAKPALADVKLFALLAQAIVVQGLLGLILAFYFAASDDAGDDRRGDD